jgi:hypothetical protein
MMMNMALFFARLSLNSVLKPKALLSVHLSCNNPTDLDMDLEEKMRTQATICKPNSEMRALLRLSYTQAIDITTLFNTVRTLGLLLQCHLFVALLSFS